MSFYRSIFAAVAAVAIASPVFADDSATTTTTTTPTAAVQTDTSTGTTATTTTTQTSDATSTTDSKIDLNKASAKDLMKVKGINASKARAIVAYRKKHGDFKSVSDLSKVKGFTKMKSDGIQAIQSQISVE